MVVALKLTKEEILECMRKFLKGVTIVLHQVEEYHVDHPPPLVSFSLIFAKYFSFFYFVEYYSWFF
jgi:hypothetical protein